MNRMSTIPIIPFCGLSSDVGMELGAAGSGWLATIRLAVFKTLLATRGWQLVAGCFQNIDLFSKVGCEKDFP